MRLTTLLDRRDDPQIGPPITSMRQRRREHLEDILNDPHARLLLPVSQAAALAFVLTSHENLESSREGIRAPSACGPRPHDHHT